MMIAMFVLCSLSAIFLLITTFFFVRSMVLVRSGNAVSGRVIDLQRVSSSEGGDTYLPIFEYMWQGQPYRKSAGFSSNPPRYSVGETITLYVDAANPADAVPKRFMDLWFMPLFFGLFAGVMGVIGIGLIVAQVFGF